MNEILKEEELPKYYVGISPCFRREAGTYGKDTKGLYRIHQFQKVEQVVICKADDSLKEHQHILANSGTLATTQASISCYEFMRRRARAWSDPKI